jgi:hypothetical protein
MGTQSQLETQNKLEASSASLALLPHGGVAKKQHLEQAKDRQGKPAGLT